MTEIFNYIPSSIEIFQVAVVLGFIQTELQVLLCFRDVFESIRDLETLHVLNNPSQFVILVKVQ